jgi:hypothetical protein
MLVGKVVSCLRHVQFERPGRHQGGDGQQAFGCRIRNFRKEAWTRAVWEFSPPTPTMAQWWIMRLACMVLGASCILEDRAKLYSDEPLITCPNFALKVPL